MSVVQMHSARRLGYFAFPLLITGVLARILFSAHYDTLVGSVSMGFGVGLIIALEQQKSTAGATALSILAGLAVLPLGIAFPILPNGLRAIVSNYPSCLLYITFVIGGIAYGREHLETRPNLVRQFVNKGDL